MTVDLFPSISAVICTRNRGASALETVRTILANTHSNFELLVIDQSTNSETEDALRNFLENKRFRYVRSSTKGAGKARNFALSQARGEIVAYTDDDCLVPENWLSQLEKVFSTNPKVAVVFTTVEPGPYDPESGYIPSHIYPRDRVVTKLREYYGSIGMGAGMAVRRTVALDLGGIDELLGPGSRFGSAEDHDIAVRAFLNNWFVYEAAHIKVTHLGFRTNQELRELTHRDWRAMGAVYAKPVRCARFEVLGLMAYNGLSYGIWQPFSLIFRGHKPRGFRRLYFLLQGFFEGLRIPVNCQLLIYEQQLVSESVFQSTQERSTEVRKIQ